MTMTALDTYMTENGIADADLAQRIACDRSYVTYIRRGQKQPSLPVALKLHEVTGIPVAAFVKHGAT